MKLRVCTLFSGYDSQCMALDRLKEMHPEFDYELVAWAEIDKYAIQAHNAVYPQWSDRNYGDVSKIDWNQVPDFDLLTYSSPCQDFSNAGKQAGGEEGSGTRSSLLWEVRRAILAKKPKYMLMENVAALVSKKFIGQFKKWQLELSQYGYTNFSQVLNVRIHDEDTVVPNLRDVCFFVRDKMHISRRSKIGDTSHFLKGIDVDCKNNMRVINDNPTDAVAYNHRLRHITKFHRIGTIKDLVLHDFRLWIII